MRLSPLLLGAALLTPMASSVAQVAPATSEQVIQQERTMWQYVKEHRFAPLRAALDSTAYVAVNRHGVHGMPMDAARLEWTSLDRYELSSFEVRALDPETLIVTYKAVLNGMSLGIRVAGSYWMSTIWRMKDGKWLAIFHSESKV